MENEKKTQRFEEKQGFTKWLKLKILGGDQTASHVDTQFLADLVDTRTIGRYEIKEKLGQGSMGVVYLGKDPYINREVAIKVSRPASDIAEGKLNRYRQRFFLEAQSAGRLMHPNIVAIYDAGMHKDFCYITMEYVDGHTLRYYCNRGNLLPFSKVASIIFHACQALDYAHLQGIIHRDIKPSNIMLTKAEDVKITDFGIAQIRTDQAVSKGIIGSPCYMSPEQVKEETIENLSDIFSLGCVLYEMLSGEKAFPGENYFSILYRITNEEPKLLEEIRADIPPILKRITKKALAKDPDKRYQSCQDFAYDLRVAVRGLTDGAPKRRIKDDVIEYVHNVQFFQSFTKGQVKGILDAASIIKVKKGITMISEGDIDDSFYIILSGKAVVQKAGSAIAFIGRGECFGEMAYLSGDSRTASVVANTDCILLKISAVLLDKSPDEIQLLFLKRFASTLLRRLSTSNSKNN